MGLLPFFLLSPGLSPLAGLGAQVFLPHRVASERQARVNVWSVCDCEEVSPRADQVWPTDRRGSLISELTILSLGQITSCLWPQFLPSVNDENSWPAPAPAGSDEV